MKAAILILGGIAIGAITIFCGVHADYEWSNNFGSKWSLAVKASTIQQKSEYVDQFVAALEGAGLAGTHDALFFPTEDNSFDSNLKALKSLQGRLHDIQKLDESSLAYQTAIQQITAQEQDENTEVIGNLKGSWFKVHHYYLWNPWAVFGIIALVIVMVMAGFFVASDL